MQEVDGNEDENEDKNAQLKKIVAEVKKTSVIPCIPELQGNELVVFSDIEGKPCELLEKLKSAGVIDGVNNADGKIEIKLNPAFHGTISFCGDLTSYKTDKGEVLIEKPYGNEIVIEVFEALLEQIKKHNQGKDKKQQIQFVAVPGNHEFLECCGDRDLDALVTNVAIDKDCKNITKKTSLLAKIKGLKVIAEIQKYFLEQACENKDDIADNDYDLGCNEDNIRLNIERLGGDIKKLNGMIDNIDECLKQVSKYADFDRELLEIKNSPTEEPEKQQNEEKLYKKWGPTLTQLKQEIGPLFWKYSNVLLKMVFCHQNKKFRILHSFSLFTPENYLNKDGMNECINEEMFKQKQQQVYSKAFEDRYLNDYGIERKNLPAKQCFSNNRIPTLVGHEGGMSPGGQTDSVYCVDHTHNFPGGLVFIVDENNYIKPYYTEKLLLYKQKEEQDGKKNKSTTSLWSEKKYGDVFGKKKQLKIFSSKALERESKQVKINISTEEYNRKIIKESDKIKSSHNERLNAFSSSSNDDRIKIIENYVNHNQGASNQQLVANAIGLLIDNDGANFLEKYRRIFAFSLKDKRAQQVYKTYKMLAESQNETNIVNQPKQNQTMIELNSIHCINTPCGGCF